MTLDPKTLVLDLRSLPPGVTRGAFDIPLGEVDWCIDDVEPEDDQGVLELTVDLQEEAVLCSGTLRATFQTPCARCLEPVGFQVREDIARSYTWEPGRKEEDELETIPNTGELPLLDAVREAIILSVPGKPLCSPECPGIDYI